MERERERERERLREREAERESRIARRRLPVANCRLYLLRLGFAHPLVEPWEGWICGHGHLGLYKEHYLPLDQLMLPRPTRSMNMVYGTPRITLRTIVVQNDPSTYPKNASAVPYLRLTLRTTAVHSIPRPTLRTLLQRLLCPPPHVI